ncbi:sulfate permease [Gigaspora margarita]|uniref:Sulfate permease n=1 Tax=Gigaspora margarita TaxID=4874 RepID=A0A8H3XBK8_GIGMA|nr:sulfate permease [Gigaspora margarita]
MMSNNDNLLYKQKQPSLSPKFNDIVHNFPHYTIEYVKSLFPIRTWILGYNKKWLAGDLVAGLTVSAVIIPQAMAYGSIIGIPVEYGLYTSFVGMIVYTLFATTKDATIGPTAVLSIILAQTIRRIKNDFNGGYSDVDIVTTVTLFAGIVSLIIGFLRLGWIFNLIPSPVISGYITASVITISIGQLPFLFGFGHDVVVTNPPYRIIIDFFRSINKTKIDVVIGLISLSFLFAMKFGCSYLEKRYSKYKKLFFFIGISRYIICILVNTFISWLILRNKSENNFPFTVVKTVPNGLKHIKVPPLASNLVFVVLKNLYIIIIVSLLEHLSIAKSFGRFNGYKIDPSQEIIAIGVTNTIGCFLGAIPATGSFSRSALKARTGVLTPFAGVISGSCVLLSLYLLTPVFYYIPQAALSAVIIQAVLVLLTKPSYVKMLYNVNVLDFVVFSVSIIIAMFSTLDWSIIASWGLSLLILLLRIAFPRIDVLNRLFLTDYYDDPNHNPMHVYVPKHHPSFSTVESLPDGILAFRIQESIIFPNANYICDQIVDYVKLNTYRMYKIPEKKGNQPWNETDDLYGSKNNEKLSKLRAIIYDFSSVVRIDTSGLQALIDIKNAVCLHPKYFVSDLTMIYFF